MAGRERVILLGLGLLVLGAGCSPASSPTPSPSTDPTAATSGPPRWPGPDSTGVPVGTELRPWRGDCTVTERGTVVDARLVECDLRVLADDVVITRSRILGSVLVPQPEQGGSFEISDSEVAVGDRLVTALGHGNFTARRVEVTGGRRSVNCEVDCTLEHSWVHDQAGDAGGEAHLSGVRMGRNTTIRFNTVVCEGERIPPASGCSAALTGYGDFAPVENNLVEGNLFESGTASFCAFGGSTDDKPFSDDANRVRFVDNVFARGESGTCGIHGAVAGFDNGAPGNVWEGNVYEDGEPVVPRD